MALGSVGGLAGFCLDVLVTQTLFKAIPLSSLVSLKIVKAPRAGPRSVRGLVGFYLTSVFLTLTTVVFVERFLVFVVRFVVLLL